MNNIDLNIDNYDLNDILNLFKIPLDFDENDLKKAKKIVLMTHPDKSKLHADYFRFYTKAYKTIYSLWEFKNKHKNLNNYNLNYKDNDMYFDAEKKEILNNYLEKIDMNKTDKFNKWFNNYFEKNRIKTEQNEHGYGDWLKSEEDIEENKNISQSQMSEEIERKKQKMRALIINNGIMDINSSFIGSELTNDIPQYYGSDLFSNLKFEDLRKAHTETVVPVTLEDYNNVKKFNNINEFNIYRKTQDLTPLSGKQALDYLHKKNKIIENESNITAFKLAKEMEEAKKKIDNSWNEMRLLSNK
jgi:hypothetical protein